MTNLIKCFHLKIIIFSCGIVIASNLFADAPWQQTQAKLKQLNEQIGQLQHRLDSAHNKKAALNKELALTEKQIGNRIQELRSLQNNIKEKSSKITNLKQQTQYLNQQLLAQQQLLANHLRARYQMGEYQPLKWLLNQEDPYKISRILNYYQYLVKSRQQLIEKIDNTRRLMQENETSLQHELAENQSLQNQLLQQQQQLEHSKQYHQTVIKSLSNEIQNQQNSLKEAQKNKANLSQLLHSLVQQSVPQQSKPFRLMRKKLPLPIRTAYPSIQKMNQGLTFFAAEGTAVTAVYPGKVVFSDWLKGYGLLLIIDHGEGFMTLYAHNESLFKQKGQYVRQNEQIANVGHTGGIKQTGLYFEIRLRGKTVSPREWLA